MGLRETASKDRPSVRARGILGIISALWSEIRDDHVPLVAAALAYHATFGLLPSIAAAAALLGQFGDSDALKRLADNGSILIPKETTQLLEQFVTAVPKGFGSGLGLALNLGAVILTAYSAASSLLTSLNVVYDAGEHRGWPARSCHNAFDRPLRDHRAFRGAGDCRFASDPRVMDELHGRGRAAMVPLAGARGGVHVEPRRSVPLRTHPSGLEMAGRITRRAHCIGTLDRGFRGSDGLCNPSLLLRPSLRFSGRRGGDPALVLSERALSTRRCRGRRCPNQVGWVRA